MKIDWAVLQTTCRETILANWWEREYEKLPPETKYHAYPVATHKR